MKFPPCTGGCIVDYFLFVADMLRFLPVREGVS